MSVRTITIAAALAFPFVRTGGRLVPERTGSGCLRTSQAGRRATCPPG
jgi:hypothetical protein